MPLIIGIIGALLSLYAFIMLQSNIWKNDDLKYDLSNFIGSALLLVYSLMTKVYPFAVLNTVWAVLSLKDVIIDLRRMGLQKGKK
jgi:hypothetical protein